MNKKLITTVVVGCMFTSSVAFAAVSYYDSFYNYGLKFFVNDIKTQTETMEKESLTAVSTQIDTKLSEVKTFVDTYKAKKLDEIKTKIKQKEENKLKELEDTKLQVIEAIKTKIDATVEAEGTINYDDKFDQLVIEKLNK